MPRCGCGWTNGSARFVSAGNEPAAGRLARASGLLRLQVQVASYHPGEELPAPASLAHEPARPAARPPRVDLFVPWSTQAAVTGLAGVPWISWRWSAACRRLGITRLCCGRLDGCIGCVLGTVWGVMRVSWYGSIDTRSRCASVCSSRECGTSGRSTAMGKRVNNEVMDDAEQTEDRHGDGNAVEPGGDSIALSR